MVLNTVILLGSGASIIRASTRDIARRQRTNVAAFFTLGTIRQTRKMTYQSTLYVALVILGVFASSGLAFVSPTATQHQRCSGGGGLHMTADGRNASPYCRQQSILFSTPSEDDLSTSTEITVAKEESVEVPAPPAAAAEAPSEEEGTQYPLNVPSPLLLASAMLLAIISTGRYILCMSDDAHCNCHVF